MQVTTVGAVLAGVLVAPAGSAAATDTSALTDTTAWRSWVSSPADGTRKLASVAPSTDPATAGVVVDPTATRQTWQGVGASLTDSSVALLSSRPGAMKLLFDPRSNGGARLNLARLPLSATDFSTRQWSFTWNAKRRTLTDTAEARRAAAMIRSIVALRPGTSVVAVPWTAPASMKSNRSLRAGALKKGQESAYADLLVAQVTWLRAKGVPVRALSLGNEPGYADPSYPTMTMTDGQMAAIARKITKTLAARKVALWAMDHNWSDRDRVDALLAAAPGAFAQVAFHCYEGTPTQMAGLRIPSIVSECTGTRADDAATTFAWDADQLVLDPVEAGSTGLMMWNLALDPSSGPKLAGGCANCRGLLEIDPATGRVTPQPEFWVLAQLSRAADVGAVNLGVESPSGLPMVAFRNHDGTIGVFGHNDTDSTQVVSVRVLGGSERRFAVRAGEIYTFRGAPGPPDDLRGKIVRTTDGAIWFVDAGGVKHSIDTAEEFTCHGGYDNSVENVAPRTVGALALGVEASCPT